MREQKVLIDADLAELYGVPTKALNQAVKRNAERFPMDFILQLSEAEKAEVITNPCGGWSDERNCSAATSQQLPRHIEKVAYRRCGCGTRPSSTNSRRGFASNATTQCATVMGCSANRPATWRFQPGWGQNVRRHLHAKGGKPEIHQAAVKLGRCCDVRRREGEQDASWPASSSSPPARASWAWAHNRPAPDGVP